MFFDNLNLPLEKIIFLHIRMSKFVCKKLVNFIKCVGVPVYEQRIRTSASISPEDK